MLKTSSKMLIVLAACLLALAGQSQAYKVMVAPGKTECISQNMEAAHFEVSGAARVEGAVFVSPRYPNYQPSTTLRLHSPSGEQIWSQQSITSEAHFNIAAHGPGVYKLCMYNGYESHVDVYFDLVYFTLGHLRRPGQVQVPKGSGDTRDKQMASKDHLEDVKREVLVVGELIEILSGEQKYLQRKLERHIKTVKSNNARTFWYTGLEVLVLLLVTGVNLAVTTGFFKGGPSRITV